MKRLAIITTHPIQYNAPWFKLLAQRGRLHVRVFYTWGEAVLANKFDPGFQQSITWDIPLLDGYDAVFPVNTSTAPGSHHFKGIVNPGLIREIQDWEPDSILVFGWSFQSHLQVLRHFYGKIPILFRGDSTLLDEHPGFQLRKLARRLFLRWVYGHINQALYVGSANKNYYTAHGVKDKNLRFAPHAIDNDRFTKDDAGNLRVAWGIPENAFVFLYAGKFEAKKAPLLLIESFVQILANEQKEVLLLMVGDGPLLTGIKEKIGQQSKSVQQLILIKPFQNQAMMPAVYKTADVFVLPSSGPGETWGLSVNEAMACSRAVLVSDHCGCAVDLVQENKNGYTFESGNNDDLVQKMEALVSSRSSIGKLGIQSLQIIQDWNFLEIVNELEKTLECN